MVEAASGVGESVNQGTEGIGRGLSAKVGPLPVWGWLVVLGVGGAAVYFLVLRKGGGAGGTAYSGWGFPTGGGGGDGGGGGGAGITPPTPTNAGWLSNAIQGAATGLGLSESEVAYYLREYLAGNVPTGNTQAYSTFQKVIDYATQNFGQPPIAPTAGAPGVSYYTTQQNWFNDLLGFLPSGTSASITQELQALFSGTTTTISQDAANAYNAAVGIIGLGPTGGLNFTITGTTTTTNPPTVPSLTSADIDNWQKAFFAGVEDFGNWIKDAPATIRTTFSAGQQQQIYSFFNAQSAKGIRYSTADLVSLLNGWLANPSTLPQVPNATGGPGVPGPSR